MDAACGPSNGVKSLQRHFEQDRALQREGRARTDPGARGPAFRDGPTAAERQRASQEQQAFLRAGRYDEGQASRHGHDALRRQDAAPLGTRDDALAWSRDFGVADAQRRQQQQQPVVHAGGWGQEFFAMQDRGKVLQQHHQAQQHPSFQQQQQPMMSSMVGFAPLAQISPYHSQGATQSGESRQHFAEPAVDQTAAFDQAFAAAERSLEAVRLSPTQAERTAEREPLAAAAAASSSQDEEMMRRLDDGRQESMAELETRLGADALADTAGSLIEAMREERGDKFRASRFMALMHRLRDREVVVEGDRMVDAGTGADIASHLPPGDGDDDHHHHGDGTVHDADPAVHGSDIEYQYQ